MMLGILEKIKIVYQDVVEKQKQVDSKLVDITTKECSLAEAEKALKAKAEDVSTRESNLGSPEELVALSATTKAALAELKNGQAELEVGRTAFVNYRETEKNGIISKRESLDNLISENLKREVSTKEKLAEAEELKKNYKKVALEELMKKA